MPGLGEVLLATVPVVVSTPGIPGFYVATVSIPDSPTLINARFFAQGLFLDATTPAEPLRLTNEAAEVHIGLD